VILSLALAAVLAVGALAPADATPAVDPPEWQSTYNRLITEIMSPYCHGLTLDNCPTQGATELRNEIKTWLMAGRSEDWVLDELELRFGPSILGAPRLRGMGLVAWLVPPVFFFFGTIGVVVWLRRHTMTEEKIVAE
jgi:cytochrome c-type biogenesis protein CcmH/NrfF